MDRVFHNGQFRSFKLCVLRGDGWGCVVFSDNSCWQINRSQINGTYEWATTGVHENLSNFISAWTEPDPWTDIG